MVWVDVLITKLDAAVGTRVVGLDIDSGACGRDFSWQDIRQILVDSTLAALAAPLASRLTLERQGFDIESHGWTVNVPLPKAFAVFSKGITESLCARGAAIVVVEQALAMRRIDVGVAELDATVRTWLVDLHLDNGTLVRDLAGLMKYSGYTAWVIDILRVPVSLARTVALIPHRVAELQNSVGGIGRVLEVRDETVIPACNWRWRCGG